MKKSLIALAALATVAGAAQAQSSVSVYGILDVGYSDKESTTLTYSSASNSYSKTVTNTNGVSGVGAESTSRLGFKGTEDLGGGLKANFVVETGLNPAESTVSAWNTRQAYAGLEGGFGTLNVGTVYTPQHLIAAGFSASTLPNVVGDVLYTAAVGSSLGVTLDKVGITTTGTIAKASTLATLDEVNYALQLASLNNATRTSAGSGGVAATTGTVMAVDNSGDNTADALSLANATAKAQALLNTKATADLNARLARSNNSSYTVRVNNTVAYQSPVINGVTGGVAYVLPTQTKVEGGDESTSSATALNLQYAAGKFAAAVAYTAGTTKSITNVAKVSAGALSNLTTWTGDKTGTASTQTTAIGTTTIPADDQSTTTSASTATVNGILSTEVAAKTTTVEVKTKETMAALSYDLGVAKVSYIYAKRDAKDTVSDLSKKTTHNFGVKAPFGKATAFAIYSTGTTKVLDGTANAAEFDLTGTQVGVSYALSKRSDVYAIYGTNKMDNVANANDIKDTQYAVGLRHSF